MKKKVLIYALKMTVGGVEKALLGQFSQFPNEQYDITLVLQNKIGEFLEYIPSYVTVVEHSDWKKVRQIVQSPIYISAIDALKQGKISLFFRLSGLFILTKIKNTNKPLIEYALSLINDYPGEYDLAIDYAGPTSFSSSFVAKKIKATEKWTWVHFDVNRFPIDKKVIDSVYPEFDRINVVSTEGKKHFDKQFPKLASHTYVFYNIMDLDVIYKLASTEHNPYNRINSKTIICTVGRISKEKGQLMTIFSLKELVDAGYDVHWCFVGDGDDLQKCKNLSKELGMEDYVTFAGLQKNPYPWMKYCSVYVQPSEHEGYCITLAEAKLFNIPIVTTSFTGASEQLKDYKTPNEIVEYDAHEIAGGIRKIIDRLKC